MIRFNDQHDSNLLIEICNFLYSHADTCIEGNTSDEAGRLLRDLQAQCPNLGDRLPLKVRDFPLPTPLPFTSRIEGSMPGEDHNASLTIDVPNLDDEDYRDGVSHDNRNNRRSHQIVSESMDDACEQAANWLAYHYECSKQELKDELCVCIETERNGCQSLQWEKQSIWNHQTD